MAAAPPPAPRPTRIVDLRPSLQPVTVQFIVLDKGEKGRGGEGKEGKQ
jgi:hypothetical protein